MASISQGLVLTTAMLVSSTVLYLAFSTQKTTPSFLIHWNSHFHDSNKGTLRSCLYSEEKKRKRKKKKKKVQFADNVKESRETSEVGSIEKQRKQNGVSNNCRQETSETSGMPANRIALYNGILRDRVHRIQCSY
ncbi:uncharacterized protein LOC113855241 [Abrus precatorius]|uniref:Uncharacterized protein LOC113855241 n=1 Tax=Abrus precatorius TaxID=3816 RepID=A0A8B8KFK8_ABRPR|nr:uncharacterized protein LOC113855241 [Abrus precatorius]